MMGAAMNVTANSFVSAPRQRLWWVSPSLESYSRIGWVTLVLGLLAATIWTTETSETSYLVRTMNVFVPLYFLTIFPYVAWRLMRADRQVIWTPLLLFLAHTALFKGLGPLVSQFGNAATLAYINYGIWARSDIEQLQTNILNLVAAGVIMVTAIFVLRLPRVRQFAVTGTTLITESSYKGVMIMALLFLILGAINRYALVLPFEWGLREAPPPGIATALKNLIDLGLALIAYLSIKRGGGWTILFWIVFPAHILTLILDFRKSVVMLALLLPAFTAYIAHGQLRRLMVWVLSALLIYAAITPVAAYGRQEIITRGGEDVYNASLGERVEIVRNLLADPDAFTAASDRDGRQKSWLRLDYSGQQAYVMREFDRRGANPTIFEGLWRLIPRAIWPDKPTDAGPGRSFFQYVTSSDMQARVGVTFYADAYWNGGWAAVVLVCSVIGAFLGFFTALAMRWLRSSDFIMFPAILLVADFSLRGLNGWIQNSYTLIPYLLFYWLAVSGVRRKVRREAVASPHSLQACRPNAHP